MTTLIGTNLSAVTFSTATSTSPVLGGGKGFSVGTRHTNNDGKEYVFIQANSAVSQYDVVNIPHDAAGPFIAVSYATSVGASGQEIGVAQYALASGDYGWVQVKGNCRVNVLGSCAKNVTLWSTTTAGALDDATASNFLIQGLIIVSTNPTASATNMEGFLNYPTVVARAGTA